MERTSCPAALELLPSRVLELRYLLWKSGLKSRRIDWGRTYRNTLLGRCRTPIYLSEFEVYTLTHVLFYQTDFSGPALWMPASERQRIVPLIEALLVDFWRAENFDAISELLLNLLALDQDNTPLFKASAASLIKVWRPDGILPGPEVSEFPSSFECDADRQLVFRRCYHTVLVGILLCSAYIYRRSNHGRFVTKSSAD
jgi:hypothetical protein